MNKFFDKIKNKIKEKFDAEELLIFDNSYLHRTHKSFNPNKFHLKIKIKSKQLVKMSKIEGHKAIFSILKEEMQTKIHALEIEIN